MPVLNPDHKMTDFLNSLLENGFGDIIIVNDGSCTETLHYFEEAAQHPEVTVLTHEVNRGKGQALKTAFEHLAHCRSDIDAAVTVDGDGQHDVSCINRCLEAFKAHPDSVILGGRDFSKSSVPAGSRAGNRISSVVYRFAIGIKLKDTQTGLRVVPARYFELFAQTEGERYEYETNMLIAIANHSIPYIETPIETIYIDDNASSHFNTLTDSVKIYLVVLRYFFKFVASSLSSWLVDIGVFFLTGLLLDNIWPEVSAGSFHLVYDISWRVFICTITSRVISCIVNYILNRKTVFKATDNVAKTAGKYYTLALCQLIASLLLVDLFAVKLLNVTGVLQTVVKCVVDGCLFFFSYGIQRKWVFKNKK